ncbi:MAG: cytochrome c oxidase assembly protein [Acidimicrobiia bacterium]
MDITFHPHLDVYGVAIALIFIYEFGIRRLAGRYAPPGKPPVTTAQRVMYYAGVIFLLISSTWPLHDIGEQRLYLFHMTEHMLITLVVPPLLLGGMPGWLMHALVEPFIPLLKVITRPMFTLVFFNVWLAFIHVPSVVELMLTNDFFHFFAHLVLFISAVLMWWPVMDPIPETKTLAPFGKMGYLFLQSLVPTIPASFMTLGETPLYEIYTTFPRLWGIDVMTDQIIAGLIMKIGGGLVLWVAIAWVFFSWYDEEQKHETGPIVVPRASAGAAAK